MSGNKKIIQVFTIAACLTVSVLGLSFSHLTQKSVADKANESSLKFSDLRDVKEALPEEAFLILPKNTEQYFQSIGYSVGKGEPIEELKVLDSSVEQSGETTIFRCFYEETDTNTLVVTYNIQTKKFMFEIEEQKE